jgi:hypothetical protein
MHITLDYQGDGLDLSLISPDGRQHALYADPTGFGSVGREFRLRNPAPGPWLVCIRGMKGGGERVTFRVVAIL